MPIRAVLCLLLAAAFLAAAPVRLPNAGLTIELPSGWTLDSVAASDGKPSYLWHPADSLPRILMGVELYDSVPSDSAAEWTYTMSYAHKLSVENDACLSGEVFSWSYYGQDGLPGAFVNSYLTLDAYCQGDVLAWQDRFFALRTHGWQLWFAGDTAEIERNYTRWSSLLDSVKVDRSWAGWSPLSLAAPRTVRPLRWSVEGGLLRLEGLPGSEGWLLDSRGRPVRALRLDARGVGRVAMSRLPSDLYHARLTGKDASGLRLQGAALPLAR